MSRCIITYADGPHEELLDVALPGYEAFAHRHGYDLHVASRQLNGLTYTGGSDPDLPPAWQKVPLLLGALQHYDEVVWFDCDLVIVNSIDDFPPLANTPSEGVFTSANGKLHSMVRHFAWDSEVPNSGVWRLRRQVGDVFAAELLNLMMKLDVFTDHGWWEQAALMTLMGYTVPPQGSDFRDTRCRCVRKTRWYDACQFMRLCWNSHPNYRADKPRIVHCSYTDMQQRLDVMRTLVRNPHFDYPRYNVKEEKEGDNDSTNGHD